MFLCLHRFFNPGNFQYLILGWSTLPLCSVIDSYQFLLLRSNMQFHLHLIYHIGPRHGCPSRGTPNHLMALNNHTARIDPQLIPSPEEAVRQYQQAGGHITHFSEFGKDLLATHTTLSHQREAEFHQRYPNFELFSHKLVNDDDSVFRAGLLFLIQITQTLTNII